MKKVIILMGVPGSGKGTQARKIADKYGYCHISTGNLLRDIASQTDLQPEEQKEIDVMKSGGLVSSEFVYKITDREIKKCLDQGKGVVLDGVSRKVEQAEHFQTFFKEMGMEDEVIAIEVHISDDTIMKRMQIRLESEDKKRVDDDPKIIKERIEKQGNTAIKPILDYYKTLGQLVTVDGEPPIEEVEKSIAKVLED